eukprot:670115-Amphidinium_carterae.2
MDKPLEVPRAEQVSHQGYISSGYAVTHRVSSGQSRPVPAQALSVNLQSSLALMACNLWSSPGSKSRRDEECKSSRHTNAA